MWTGYALRDSYTPMAYYDHSVLAKPKEINCWSESFERVCRVAFFVLISEFVAFLQGNRKGKVCEQWHVRTLRSGDREAWCSFVVWPSTHVLRQKRHIWWLAGNRAINSMPCFKSLIIAFHRWNGPIAGTKSLLSLQRNVAYRLSLARKPKKCSECSGQAISWKNWYSSNSEQSVSISLSSCMGWSKKAPYQTNKTSLRESAHWNFRWLILLLLQL